MIVFVCLKPILTLTLAFFCLAVILTLKTDIVGLFETYIDTGQWQCFFVWHWHCFFDWHWYWHHTSYLSFLLHGQDFRKHIVCFTLIFTVKNVIVCLFDTDIDTDTNIFSLLDTDFDLVCLFDAIIVINTDIWHLIFSHCMFIKYWYWHWHSNCLFV